MASLAATPIRRAGLVALKQHAPLTALVPVARIYPMQRPSEPVWPFVAWGAPISEPFGASCLDGSQVTFAVHCYAETTPTKGGEDAADDICAAIAKALGDVALPLEGGATAHFTCTGAQVLQDSRDADSFHGFVSFRVTVVE